MRSPRFFGLCLSGCAAMLAAEARPSNDMLEMCDALPRDVRAESLQDYRLRNATERSRANNIDTLNNHTLPAARRIQNGDLSKSVMADLNFTLRGWPNHLVALKAMVDYDIGGGETFEYAPTVCYLWRAKTFAPDDADVRLLEAFYFQRKGLNREAETAYRDVLRLNPESAEAHYNLGLLYLESRAYEEARDQAKLAYSLGYPLPGLRRRLQEAGYWK